MRLGRPTLHLAVNAESEIRETFKHAYWNTPIGEALDSLSQTLLRIILADANTSYNPARFLRELSTGSASAGQREQLSYRYGKIDLASIPSSQGRLLAEVQSDTVNVRCLDLDRFAAARDDGGDEREL